MSAYAAKDDRNLVNGGQHGKRNYRLLSLSHSVCGCGNSKTSGTSVKTATKPTVSINQSMDNIRYSGFEQSSIPIICSKCTKDRLQSLLLIIPFHLQKLLIVYLSSDAMPQLQLPKQ
uniref:Uncharacterized protein n=1 Tax=Glossina pallidipes TaxID=7398 RepID=A0A1B0A4B3_GLOPL